MVHVHLGPMSLLPTKNALRQPLEQIKESLTPTPAPATLTLHPWWTHPLVGGAGPNEGGGEAGGGGARAATLATFDGLGGGGLTLRGEGGIRLNDDHLRPSPLGRIRLDPCGGCFTHTLGGLVPPNLVDVPPPVQLLPHFPPMYSPDASSMKHTLNKKIFSFRGGSLIPNKHKKAATASSSAAFGH